MNQAAKDAANFLKTTLRLPSSTFPARAPPVDIQKYLPRCTDDLYSWQRRSRPVSNTFTLHDGPPYANGELHVGHALNKILKDIICRTKLSQGRRVDYTPGWDCHGLPIELKALEHHGWARGQGKDPIAIRKAARNFASNTVKKQMKGFQAWGIMGDWQNHWKTMDKSFELRQLSVFKAMVGKGLIYRRHKPVFWSPSSGTALAEAELEYKDDHVSTAAYVKFTLLGLDDREPVYALIWTTTPWTLPANQAIAIHKEVRYTIVKSATHGRLVIAQGRHEALAEALGEDLVFERLLDATELTTVSYTGVPEFNSLSGNRPIVHADFVSTETGTGLVHCAPGHGMEDYLALSDLIAEGKVGVRAPVDKAGRFDASASPGNPQLLDGLEVFTDGNAAVLKLLSDAGRLVSSANYKHRYPIDWRTKEPVMIRATAQWFADLSSIRGDAVAALEKVAFVPDSGKSRLHSFVENRSEWCISRQRSWGVPIPALYHRESGEAILTAPSVQHMIDVIQQRGTDAWWSDALDEPAWMPEGLQAADYVRGTDTMDVWFDSGSSWKMMDSGDTQPSEPLADVYLEGTDQHRGWFQSSLLTNVAFQKATGRPEVHAPFKALFTHGFTLDAQGKKMSKSLGNVISPDQIIAGMAPAATVPPPNSKKRRETHSLGPDALRLWVASTDFTRDVTISETVVRSTHTALNKYRVTLKVLLGMLKDFEPTSALPYAQLAKLDQFALMRLAAIIDKVQRAYSQYEFHRAVLDLNKWVSNDLSGVYLEAVKDIIYCDAVDDARRISASTTLFHIFSGMQEMLAPVLPLLVEESWEHSPDAFKKVVHPLRRVQQAPPAEWNDAELRRVHHFMTEVNRCVKAAQEQARADKVLGQSLACDVALCMEAGTDVRLLPEETWQEIFVVSDVKILDQGVIPRTVEEVIHGKEAVWAKASEIKDDMNKVVGLAVVTSPAKNKCARCWRYNCAGSTTSTGEEPSSAATDLCNRCEEVVQQYKGRNGG